MNRSILITASAVCVFMFGMNDVFAGEPLKCESRRSPARSKISAEIEDVRPGAVYTAIVKSGTNSALSTKAANAFGNVEWDFDSNKKDILAGATAIAAKFIVDGSVDLMVTDAVGNIVEQTDVACRVK